MPAPRPGTRAHAREIAARLERSQGHIPWRRRNDPVSELVTTLLSHSTTDVNQLRAFEALRSRYPTWDEVRAAPTAEVEETVRVAGLAGQKAPRIQHVLDEIADDPRGDDLEWLGGHPPRRGDGVPHRPARRGPEDRRLRHVLLLRRRRGPGRHPRPPHRPPHPDRPAQGDAPSGPRSA